jgi:hypothetical protein
MINNLKLLDSLGAEVTNTILMNTKSNRFSYQSFYFQKTCFVGLGRQKLKRKERVKKIGNGISYFLRKSFFMTLEKIEIIKKKNMLTNILPAV